jgi:hypothetical protein
MVRKLKKGISLFLPLLLYTLVKMGKSVWPDYIYRYINTYVYMLPFQYINIQKTELTVNGYFRLFAANGKRKFVFLGRQMINSN